jgi:peptidoglycan/LPS O-acetylase OafA/YrhL
MFNGCNLSFVQQNTWYRNDVQGLRGFAVALVVLEHAGGLVPGGFIGVDIFFAISGYVITEQLLQALQKSNEISLSDFFSRRARRLLPAASLVIVATLFLSLFILSPGIEHSKAASAGLAAMFFVPNLRYIFEGGYFFLAADPFRHFWSLGVEEQFYLVYPVSIFFVHRLLKKDFKRFLKFFSWLILCASLVSLVVAGLLAFGFKVTPLPTRVGFFGTPFRAWEFLAGAGVSIFGFVVNRYPGRALSICIGMMGLGLIIWPAFTYDEFTLFPGLAALPPVVGTVALIYSGKVNNKLTMSLSSRPLTFFGDISYGLYLWHWPMIVFSKRLWPESQLAIWGSVLLSVLLATLQYRYIENPIRLNSRIKGKNAFLLFLGTASIVVVSVVFFLRISATGLGLKEHSLFDRPYSIGSDCGYESDWQNVIERCGETGTTTDRFLLIGDSQAAAVSDGFVGAARSMGASYSLISSNSCPIHVRPNELRDKCDEYQSNIKEIVRLYNPTVVVVANAADLYVTRGGFGRPDTLIRNSNGGFPKNYHQALDNWTDGVHDALSSDWFWGKKIIYLHMSPNPPTTEPSVLRPNPADIRFRLSAQFDRNEIVYREKQALEKLNAVTTLDPADSLCSVDICKTQTNDGPLYSDSYHVNSRGAKLLESALLRALIEQSSK